MRELTDAQWDRLLALLGKAKAQKAKRGNAKAKDLQKLSKADLIALVKELTG